MANHEQPYDPYIPSGRGTPAPNAHNDGSDRTAALQAQIDDTVNVMRQNIQRTEERGGRLDDMRETTDRMRVNAEQFHRGSNRVYKQMWWKNVRMWIWIILGLIVAIVIIALAVHFGKK